MTMVSPTYTPETLFSLELTAKRLMADERRRRGHLLKCYYNLNQFIRRENRKCIVTHRKALGRPVKQINTKG